MLSLAVLVGCIPQTDGPPVDGPEPPAEFTVVATASTPEIFEGGSASLMASVDGGVAPYLYRWDQNGGPEDVPLDVVVESTLTTGTISMPGRYVFRVVVTDQDGTHAAAFAVVQVAPLVSASAPEVAIVNEPVELSATLETATPGVTTLWEVTRGTATVDDPAALSPMLTTSTGETVEVRLTVTIPGMDSAVSTSRDFAIVSVFDLMPRVRVETNIGEFVLELNGEAAEAHMVNFLRYVDDGFYEGTIFHRNACSETPSGDCEPFVLQAGGYHRVDGELVLKEPTRDPVDSEADNGLSNGTLYSVALALTGADFNSGATQFFINLDEGNDFLDDQNFTVFAQVVEGTDVIDGLTEVETTDNPFLPGEMSLPVDDVVIERMTRVSP